MEFNSKLIRLKKMYDDAETVLAYKQQQGYVVNQWYKVRISVSKNQFSVYLGKISEIPSTVFE